MRIKWIVLVTWFLAAGLSFLPLNGQPQGRIERLITILPSLKNPVDKVDTLNEIAWLLRKQINDPRAFQYADAARELAAKVEYSEGLGHSYVRLGLIYHYSGKYDKAITALDSALVIRQTLADTRGIASVYLNLGNSHHENHEPQKAILHFQNGIKLLDQQGDIPASRAKLLNALGISFLSVGEVDSASIVINQGLHIRRNDKRLIKSLPNSLLELGTIYRHQGLLTNAIDVLHESLYHSTEQNDSLKVGQSYTSLGNVFLDAERFDSSYFYYKKAFDIYQSKNRIKGLGILHNNVGKLFLKTRSYGLSQEHLLEALHIRKILSDTTGLAMTELLLGELYFAINKPDSAIVHFERSQQHTNANKNPLHAITLYQKMAEAYREQGLLSEALEVLSKSTTLKNELEINYQQANDLQFSLAREKAVLARKEKEIKELQLQRTITKTIVLVILLLSICIILLYRHNLQRQKRQIAEHQKILAEQKVNQLLDEAELRYNHAQMTGEAMERRRISRDLHDKVGSMLTTAKLLLSAFSKNLPELPEKKAQQYKEAKDVLVEASEEIRRISHNLHSGKMKESGLIKQVEEMALKIQAAELINIEVSTHKMQERLDLNKEIVLYRIIRELVSNVLKHARAKNISIQLNKFKKVLNIIVEDDGRGFNRQALVENRSGIGLNNAFSSVKSLGGKITIDSGRGAGTSISIDIPINESKVEY